MSPPRPVAETKQQVHRLGLYQLAPSVSRSAVPEPTRGQGEGQAVVRSVWGLAGSERECAESEAARVTVEAV